MTVIRCSQKLLERLKQPANPPEPASQDNPLGDWYGDIDFFDRQPFVLLMNGATGLVLVLPGHAEFLPQLHRHAAERFAIAMNARGIRGALAQAELDAWRQPATCARNRNRELTALMTQRKDEVRALFADAPMTNYEVTEWMLDRPPTRMDPGQVYRPPIDLVRARLLPSTNIFSFPASSTRH